MRWRNYEPFSDRAEVHDTLRARIRTGAHEAHPGEFDWMYFHRDPRYRTDFLIDDGALAIVSHNHKVIDAYGADVDDTIALGAERFGGEAFSIAWLLSDRAGTEALSTSGFALQTQPDPIFIRPAAGGVRGAVVPDGITLRHLRGEREADTRAAAARRAFKSDMEPDAHTERYRQFMRSPAYDADRDIVAVTDDGRVAAFTVYWVDQELSLAQFEPVGTDPDFQRRGLARALFAHVLTRLEAQGIEHARVMTNGDNDAAVATYAACGFEIVDHLGWWKGSVR